NWFHSLNLSRLFVRWLRWSRGDLGEIWGRLLQPRLTKDPLAPPPSAVAAKVDDPVQVLPIERLDRVVRASFGIDVGDLRQGVIDPRRPALLQRRQDQLLIAGWAAAPLIRKPCHRNWPAL